MKIKSFTILLFNLLFFLPGSAQKEFKNPNSTPEEWHAGSIQYLNMITQQFLSKENKTKRDSAGYYGTVAGMYANLGESADTVFHYLDLALSYHREHTCSMLLSFERKMKNSTNGMYFGKLDPQRYMFRLVKCENYLNSLPKSNDDDIRSNLDFDQNMINLIENMIENDQKYRFVNRMDKQKPYDDENRILLDSIFRNYGYPGKSKVGEMHSSYIATIFLHMGLEFQEKWLHLLIDAFKSGELDRGSIVFALDRIHTFKHNKQFFGSQRILDNDRWVEVPRYSAREQREILKELNLTELIR